MIDGTHEGGGVAGGPATAAALGAVRNIRNIVVDLDGVMWVGERPVPGSADGVNRLVEAGRRVVFVTNMSRLTTAEQQRRLQDCGVRPPVAVVSSAVAAASLLAPGERVLVCGGEGIAAAVESVGATVLCYASAGSWGHAGGVAGGVAGTAGDVAAAGGVAGTAGEAEPVVDAVIVGMDSSFDYWACGRAMRAVRAGARLIGTNHDPTYPTPARLEAGGGAILAAVATAAETEPLMAGKPNGAMVGCVQQLIGAGAGLVVGDRADSDGLFAAALGYDFALVLSGVTGPDDLPVDPPPALVADDLAGVAEALLAH